MIAHTLTATVIGIAALTGATPAPVAPPLSVTVFSENINNLVTAETAPTSERLATLHTHDELQLVSPTPVTAAWGDFYNVFLPDGRTGWIKTSVVVPTPTTTLADLTEASVVVAPSAGGGWLGQMAAGSSAAFTYPTTMSSKISVPEVGTPLDCAPFEVTASAGVLGDVAMTPCDVQGQVGYIRSEHIAPAVDLATLPFSGTATAAEDTPVYAAPAATSDTIPEATIAAGTAVKTGTPTGAFTPVQFEGQSGWAPTKILFGIESWTDKVKDRAGVVWGKTKEIASTTKDKLGDQLDNVEVSTPAVVNQVRDVPALVLAAVLVALTLAMAWVRRVGVFPLPKIARRVLNLAAVIPLLILAGVAPIASYGFALWIVLGVALAVSAGVLSGFKPDLTQAAAVARTRKAQIVAGVAVAGGALVGAVATGFAGWLAPLVAGMVALAAASGYLLSAPDDAVPPVETTDDASVETEEVPA